ncbi:Transcription factor [Penicillium malachiteum]|uniref:Transcription factor n=1 Tax=Penicillium malachiteum TaxID=1324776 RepID=UPI0025491313|nr:Transcription factor [Penicillium malachiteum]KAJ5714910.1 Transcription factor [Penicillium malachiteum]
MTPSEEPDHATQAPASKRRRVAVACDACRARKSRCDGTRPRCSLCSDLGFECVYTPPTTATNLIVQKDYLHGLEDRVKKLEDSLLSVRDDIVGLSARVDSGPGLGSSRSDDERQRIASVPDLIGTEDSVDAMGAMTFADEEDSGFFGPSSNIAFLRNLSHAVIQQGYLLSPGAAEGGFVSASRAPSPLHRPTAQDQRSQVNIFALPTQSETLALIRSYFSNTGLLFPYIYPPMFLDTYHQMARENFTKVRKTWLGLLNMILAMSTITSGPNGTKADSRIAESDVFYQRGLGLCGGELLRGTTLEVVQFLLLMGQYLQGTQKSVQAWTVHGLAVKAALQLGLHSVHASRTFNPLEQETRKRTWYGCVVLDRTLSMTFGRPAAIPDSYVKLELPSKRQFEKSSAFVDDETSYLSVSFFNATITLYKNLWSVIDSLYGQNIGCDPPLPVSETVSHIFNMEQSLFSWERSLPSTLLMINKTTLYDIPQEKLSDFQYFSWKFRVILTLRYLNLRVLLHRPVLVKFITASRSQHQDPQDINLLHQIGMNSLEICTASAMETIDIIHQVVSDPGWKQSLLGAWWFSLYYTFNAALVTLGAVWVYQDTALGNASMAEKAKKVREYPSRAVAALARLDDGNRLIDRCRAFLEKFTNALVDSETDHNGAIPPLPFMGINRGSLPTADFGFSPFGMELGEFMMDDDLIAIIDKQGLLPADTVP